MAGSIPEIKTINPANTVPKEYFPSLKQIQNPIRWSISMQ
jgi:hypothetical protein